MQRTVLIDIDDTIADTHTHYIEYARSQGHIIKVEDVTQEFYGNRQDYFQSLILELFESGPYLDVMSAVKPYKDALAGVQLLYEHSFDVYIASSREEYLHELTQAWLGHHGFLNYATKVSLRSYPATSLDFKLKAANSIDAIAVFDDSWITSEAFARGIPYVFLIEKPWNKNKVLLSNMRRPKSFFEGVKIFLNTEGGQH